MTTKESCFGFFGGESLAACKNCTAQRRCKAVLVSDGFTILGDSIDQMVAELPDAPYPDAVRSSEQLQVLLNPNLGKLDANQASLLGLLVGNSDPSPFAATLLD